MKRTSILLFTVGTVAFLAGPLLSKADARDRHHDRRYERHRSHYYGHPGHYGPRSGVVLQFNLTPAPVYRPAPVVRYGATRNVVADVQAALNRRGYSAGYVDGVFGARTSAAIRQYQYDNRLRVTGTINDTLLRSLRLS